MDIHQQLESASLKETILSTGDGYLQDERMMTPFCLTTRVQTRGVKDCGYMNSQEWSSGMEYWSGVLDWTTGVGGAIFLRMRIITESSRCDKLMIWHFTESQSRYIG